MSIQFAPEWIELRAGADAAARSAELLQPLQEHLARSASPLVIRDLGCGTGAMSRWLSGRLPCPQRWILTDGDPRMLARAAAGLPASVTGVTELRDVGSLTAADLADTSLVTASALLDLLTAADVDRLAAACVEAGCPALFALSVIGRVDLDPADALDTKLTAAFNAHQRRVVDGRRLLGPDAVDAVVEAFESRGATVHRRPSPWRLGLGDQQLLAPWLSGWVAAACEQYPDLAGCAQDYLRRRLDACAMGELSATVHHEDLLLLPARRP